MKHSLWDFELIKIISFALNVTIACFDDRAVKDAIRIKCVLHALCVLHKLKDGIKTIIRSVL